MSDRSIDILEIRNLKARRVRMMDTKDWDSYAACHTDDALSVTFQSEAGDNKPTIGGKAIAARLSEALANVTTCHQIHEPEIEFTSDTTASGIWPMEDMLWWQEGEVEHHLHGYGHYHETYEKVNGQWLIKSRRLDRIRVDRKSSTSR